jgi:hypothetical protein
MRNWTASSSAIPLLEDDVVHDDEHRETMWLLRPSVRAIKPRLGHRCSRLIAYETSARRDCRGARTSLDTRPFRDGCGSPFPRRGCLPWGRHPLQHSVPLTGAIVWSEPAPTPLRSWISRFAARAEAGDRRVLRFLDWIGAQWAKLPRRPRQAAEWIGRILQLDG